MSKSDKRFYGWIFVVAAVIVSWKPVSFFLRYWRSFPRARIFYYKIMPVFRSLPSSLKIRLLVGLFLLIAGIVIILKNREKKLYWQTNRKSRIRRVSRKINKLTDTNALAAIMNQAPLTEVRHAASDRRNALLRELLDSGKDLAAIRAEVNSVIQSGMYDKGRTDFLADAAKKYPDIVKEYWPKLEAWAHADSKSHNDIKPGFHTDRTDYYDYFRYPNGRTVANTNGRRRHTDSRGSYSDCHDDHHQDATVHTDKANKDKIARFKPFIN